MTASPLAGRCKLAGGLVTQLSCISSKATNNCCKYIANSWQVQCSRRDLRSHPNHPRTFPHTSGGGAGVLGSLKAARLLIQHYRFEPTNAMGFKFDQKHCHSSNSFRNDSKPRSAWEPGCPQGHCATPPPSIQRFNHSDRAYKSVEQSCLNNRYLFVANKRSIEHQRLVSLTRCLERIWTKL